MSYKPNQILRWRNKESIIVICDFCNQEFQLLYKSAEKNRKKHSGHKCSLCTGIPIKPQNNKKFWTGVKKQAHAKIILLSELYKKGIEDRNTTGHNNGMFGKKMDSFTKQKMSIKRKLRVGEKSPNWKGGKQSLNARVKKFIHREHNWYFLVYQRDNFKCVKCNSKKKIDAHHIDPINQIIKRLCTNKIFLDDSDKFTWLCQQPEIIDPTLINGITLCRDCHKKEHKNWGSHNCK